MTRPLTRQERREANRRAWYADEERKARAHRGELGAMEFWLRVARSAVVREAKAGRQDVLAGYALVSRLFIVAVEKRATGDSRIWNDLLRYAEEVVGRHSGGM